MNPSTQTIPFNPAPAGLPVLTPQQVIDKVRGLLLQSRHRIGAYPHAKSYAGNMALLHTALSAMNDAQATPRAEDKVKIILRQHNNLLALGPGSPLKWKQTYIAEVESICAACREFLGWRGQVA